jgi:hypothetical protein
MDLVSNVLIVEECENDRERELPSESESLVDSEAVADNEYRNDEVCVCETV